VIVSDRTTYIRTLLNSQQPGATRWPEAMLIAHVDRAVKALVARIRFPDSRLSLTTITTNQEYPLPEMHRIHRVYLNGQIAAEVPGNVDTLEGDQILYNDQTASGALSTGSGAAPGGTAQLPQWAVQTPTTYPFVNNFGPPAPMSAPFYPGQSPRYYRRGGWIGFVPAPAIGTIITIDGVLVPTTLNADTQLIAVPENFSDAIDAFVCNRALRSDRDPAVRELAAEWLNTYDGELKLLRTWKRDFSLEDSQIMLFPERAYFRIGGNVTGGYY